MSDLLSRIAGARINFMDRDRVMSEIVEADFSATELGPKADADLRVRFFETVAPDVVRFPAQPWERTAPHTGARRRKEPRTRLCIRKGRNTDD